MERSRRLAKEVTEQLVHHCASWQAQRAGKLDEHADPLDAALPRLDLLNPALRIPHQLTERPLGHPAAFPQPLEPAADLHVAHPPPQRLVERDGDEFTLADTP